MKKISLIICLALFSFPIFSQEKSAEISFKETIIDYGIIENGEDGKRTFEFKNTGDLDDCNGRWGVTPEYPNGVYAYYSTIKTGQTDTDGAFENYLMNFGAISYY